MDPRRTGTIFSAGRDGVGQLDPDHTTAGPYTDREGLVRRTQIPAPVLEYLTAENSGRHGGVLEAEEALVDCVISSLPNDFSAARHDRLRAVVDYRWGRASWT